ncbi:MAG: sensor histidine kinase [Elusimicrobia bacterium]|nr:sensor histidine kinase [Elusimicrobiota bacterium]
MLTLEDGKHVYTVRNIQVILDPAHSLSIEEIRRLESAGKAPWSSTNKLNLGYSKARYWLKLEIENKSAEESNWLLEFGYPLIQVLHVYRYSDAVKPEYWQTGKLAPFDSRPIAHRNYLFNFTSPKGGRTIFYFMLESSGTLLAPITVYSQKEFLGRSSGVAAGIGIYCGVILAMVLFNFFLLVTTRDKNYLYYIGYALSFCLLMNTLNGMTYQHLWPEFPKWNNISVPVLAGISYLFLALFTRSILDTRRYAPHMNAGLYAITAGALFLIFGGIFHYGLLVNKFTSFFISAAPLIVLPISLWCLRNGSPTAGYYSLAFGFFFLGAAVRAARDLAWIPQNLFADYGPYYGSAVEMLLLSLALAVRIRLLKEEKIKAELHILKSERSLAASRNELERQTAIASMAAQVAHDIRSPLAALGAAAKGLEQLPAEQRSLIEGSVCRMQGIADDLLRRYRAPGAETKAKPVVTALHGLIEQVIAEKRLQHKYRPGVKIEFTSEAADAKASIEPKEFQRLISNLVNNSVEAFEKPGTVSLALAALDGRVVIEIRDDGKGIPPDILAKLGRKGETHGKAGGTGLGLYHARTTVENWGGSLKLSSEPGKGTAVTIELPRIEAARPAPSTVILLDDDPLVHMNWKLAAKAAGAELRACKTPADLAAAIKNLPKDTPVYIDSDLGDGIKGETIAAGLYN